MKSYEVKYSWRFRLAGYVILFISAPVLYIAWVENEWDGVTISAIFTLVGIVGVYESMNTIQIDSEMIIKHKVGSRHGIKWNDIVSIQSDVTGNWIKTETMVFEGNGKRLVIFGPRHWAGDSKTEARELFYSEVGRRELEIKKSLLGRFKFSRNTRLD
jgi:hypothetical protein